jgi:hypothetical protein
MADRFSTSEHATIDRDNRNMSAASIPMSDELEDIWAAIDSGSIGITATGGQVDALALGGGHAEQDLDLTTGLTFAWKAFRRFDGQAMATISAGTIALTASNTNYVELGRDGTVYANVSAFTAGRLPLWTIVTGGSTITTVTNSKPLLVLPKLTTGAQLATAAKTKEIAIALGSISATASWCIVMPNVVGVITGVRFACATDVAANDTDYWTFGLVNKGPAGTGTTKVVDSTAAANSTKATGGTAISDYVKRSLTIDAANDDTAAGDVLELTITKAASATTMAQGTLLVELTFEE